MFRSGVFNSEEIELLRQAFVAAWKFVETDRSIGPLSDADRRKLLIQSIVAVFSSGETDVVQVANDAIALVRRTYMPDRRSKSTSRGSESVARSSHQ
jgi:hypothetical protein